VKRVFRVMILTILAISGLVGCSGKPESDAVEGRTVKVRLPWQNEQGEMKLQLVEISGLTSLYEMGGKFARFFFAPGIANGHLTGKGPKGRFLKITDNEYVPQNEISQSMASIYAHLERLAALDAKLGVGDVNAWPRDVGVNVQVSGESFLRQNNAFYDGNTDAFFFVPFKAKGLPIAVNPGVIAHEHFHSLFFKIVVKPNEKVLGPSVMRNGSNHDAAEYYHAMDLKFHEENEATDSQKPGTVSELALKFYHVALLRGLNEGLADFWGWVYTGDEQFVLHSFPTEKQRSLKPPSQDVLNRKTIEVNAQSAAKFGEYSGEKRIRSLAYIIGTQYARVFKQFTELYQKEHELSAREAREKVAVMILKELSQFGQDLSSAIANSDTYEPTQIFHRLVDNNELTKTECEFFSDVVTYTTGTSYSCTQQGNAWIIKFYPEVTTSEVASPAEQK